MIPAFLLAVGESPALGVQVLGAHACAVLQARGGAQAKPQHHFPVGPVLDAGANDERVELFEGERLPPGHVVVGSPHQHERVARNQPLVHRPLKHALEKRHVAGGRGRQQSVF